MPSLHELAEEHGGLRGAAVEQLAAVVADWQMLADLSFADLLLFCRDRDCGDLIVVAQVRPYTAPTVHHETLVGHRFGSGQRTNVARAFQEDRIVREGEPDWSTGVPVREEAIPVSLDGTTIGVVTREANLSAVRAPSKLELTYLRTADELSRMLFEGTFPFPGEGSGRDLTPRVGDGLIRLDPEGTVEYASPNAVSAYRRLGVVSNIVGAGLADLDANAGPFLEALADGESLHGEVEGRGAVVLRRLVPLSRDHRVLGGVMLVREITELRRRERLLLVKDATIREIHHRVKNNLQTVASLLRLQGRRLHSSEATEALDESVRRISSIALVHETLSQDSRERVSFDKVAERLADMLGAGLLDAARPVSITVKGSAGELPAEVATPLALVLSELLQNSVEHAFPDRGGTVGVGLRRGGGEVVLTVRDDGVGIPVDWSMEETANLGLRIASALVESELGGSLSVRPGEESGTICRAVVPLDGRGG